MSWLASIKRHLFGASPLYDAAGGGRRSRAWVVGKAGAITAIAWAQDALRAKSRDAVRKNVWAASGLEAFVSNAIGTGIKPQSMVNDAALREAIHSLWWDWCEEADAAGVLDFYGLQALATRSMLEGGECFVRIRSRRPGDMTTVPLQLQVLEAEHVPVTYNATADNGNPIRCGIEFDAIGRRVAYWMHPVHPDDPLAAPMSGNGASLTDLVRIPADEVLHLFRPL
ncbi:MAG: phage portal protein, partial [Thiomonas sp.]